MARNKSITDTQQREPESENHSSDQKALENTEPDTPRKMSKTNAIRAAVAEGHGSPGDGVDFIKTRFGLELSKQHFSATKSKLKTTGGSQSKRSGQASSPAKKAVPVEGYLAPPEQPAGRDGNLLDALEAIKPLIAQHGAESVKRMVDLLG